MGVGGPKDRLQQVGVRDDVLGRADGSAAFVESVSSWENATLTELDVRDSECEQLEHGRVAREDLLDLEKRVDQALADPHGHRRGMLPRPHADAMMNSATFRRVSHGPELFALFDALFDEPSVTLDYKHFRAVGRGNGTPFHMDPESEFAHSI